MAITDRVLITPGKGNTTTKVRGRFFSGNSAFVVGGTILLLCLAGGVASLFMQDAVVAQTLTDRLKPPAWAPGGTTGHFLGTDSLGRDVFARMLDGLRTSLLIGLLAVALGMAFGIFIGLLAGYFGGWLDTIFMRLADAVLAIPTVLLALTTIAIIGGGITNLILVIAFAQWMAFARNTRGEALVYKEMLYTTASRSLGASDIHIMVRHVLPHTVPATIVLATLSVSHAILIEAGLSFLGMGVQPPAPSLGAMLSEGRQYVASASWLAIFPGLAIFILVLGINVLGEGLRVHLDRSSK
ncbi:ABC transporter permease [Arthrobacter sp. HMWF013]|uniref:ABC transporter permease n=1 Tax=Arthrobacter sp. HMWF013 TaxID=2056849 RepID=UPI000D3D94EF|nr:ABC transporter permease [Arthrobacter sp. HMWF013]PTT70400.1 peptide ABC transporter permease [Arthrobacter sp. HMWF013]